MISGWPYTETRMKIYQIVIVNILTPVAVSIYIDGWFWEPYYFQRYDVNISNNVSSCHVK